MPLAQQKILRHTPSEATQRGRFTRTFFTLYKTYAKVQPRGAAQKSAPAPENSLALHPQRTVTEDVPESVVHTMHQFAESLGAAIDAKDSNTSRHSDEVAEIALRIARDMAKSIVLSEAWLDLLHIAGHLHDIGKIGIPDAVLMKEGPLDAEEWQCIRMHPIIGANIVAPVNAFSEGTGIREMILHHHERFDGTGYPHGLAGDNIPLGARIIAVADTLSAMLQTRPYRKALPYTEAIEEIWRHSGTQFDPEVVHALMRIAPALRNVLCPAPSSAKET